MKEQPFKGKYYPLIIKGKTQHHMKTRKISSQTGTAQV
jgi:hypothetical protein